MSLTDLFIGFMVLASLACGIAEWISEKRHPKPRPRLFAKDEGKKCSDDS